MEVYIGAEMKVLVSVEQQSESHFVARCATFPGFQGRGNTRDQALMNIKNAMELEVLKLKKQGKSVPTGITEAVVEVEI